MTITLLTPLVRAAVCFCLVELIMQLTEPPGQTKFYSYEEHFEDRSVGKQKAKVTASEDETDRDICTPSGDEE